MSVINSVFPLGFPWQTQDPFLFCVHHLDKYPEGNDEMGPKESLAGRNIGQDFTIKDGWRMYHGSTVPGFPYHPHRGFETITIAEQGFIDHTDSMGGAGRFGAGDVQWMTAGKGILHSEMFPLVHTDKDNTLEIFQIWLNLPAKSKFVEPHFKMLWADSIPEKTVIDGSGKQTTVRIIAGELHNQKAPATTPDSWAAESTNSVMLATLKIPAGGTYELAAGPSDTTRTIYFYQGHTVQVADQKITINHGVDVKPDQVIQLIAGEQDCSILVMQGKPINEPIAQHGPFVMNTQEEIRQAFADFRKTQFGGWPWPKEEQTHDRERARFALHSDGKEEVPS
ncbi:pirin family protein [Saprospiraceae bacterium]|nr:pirin family protein [Saprospiraceae bacterium]